MTLGTYEKATFMGAMGAVRHDWTRSEIRDLFALPFPDLMFQAQSTHRANFDPAEVQGLDAAVDQDRRLSGGLRLLSAERAIRHRRQGRETHEPRHGAGRGAGRQGCRRQPLLHGCGLARTQGSRSRQGVRDDRGRACDGARDLRHARHAEQRAGDPSESIRSRLLQPQPRHLAGILRRDHHHAPRIRSGSTRWSMCATPGSMCVAVGSLAWARAPRTASA